jgi:hypothetical protein
MKINKMNCAFTLFNIVILKSPALCFEQYSLCSAQCGLYSTAKSELLCFPTQSYILCSALLSIWLTYKLCSWGNIVQCIYICDLNLANIQILKNIKCILHMLVVKANSANCLFKFFSVRNILLYFCAPTVYPNFF